MTAVDLAIAHIKHAEGFRALVYDDATGNALKPGDTLQGHPTIGYGWALDLDPMDEADADARARRTVTIRAAQLDSRLPWLARLDAVRRAVVFEVAYNTGVRGLLLFRRMLAALEADDYETAAAELLDSDAGRKLPTRYGVLAARLRAGGSA